MNLSGLWRRKWVRLTVETVLFVAIFSAFSAFQKRTMVEGPAPALAGIPLSGAPYNLAAERGKPVVVHFWATWCPICTAEEGSINSLAADYPVMTVAMQSGDGAAVRRHMSERGLSMPVLLDEDGAMAARWGVRGVPATFIVDSDGMIRFREVGFTTGVGLRLRLWWASVIG
jgi:thiol-disulfide isomerase/thioredoxin